MKPSSLKFIVLILTLCILLSACTSIVKNALLKAKSYPVDSNKTQQMKDEFDIQTRQYCDIEIQCYAFYFAPKKDQKRKLNMELKAQFTENEQNTSLSLLREEIPKFKGSVILMHGFRGSKDWSLASAAYFQFLGFDVYIFDLLGHGDLDTAKGFGVKDAKYIQRFIESELPKNQPVLAIGNSMGGLVATLLVNQKAVDAAILQAPMTQFDTSLDGYFADTKPWYRFMISDSTLYKASLDALNAVGLRVEQTNTIEQLKFTNAPFLVFASNIDSVSPYQEFSNLGLENIKVIEINQVEHAYMSMIGQYEHEQILAWLLNNADMWLE